MRVIRELIVQRVRASAVSYGAAKHDLAVHIQQDCAYAYALRAVYNLSLTHDEIAEVMDRIDAFFQTKATL